MTSAQPRFPAPTAERAAPLTKSTFAYTELRRQIVNGELAPGTRVDLNELCEVLNVSRMPVREALSRLDAQGLVEIRPQAATVVSMLSIADLRDTYDARTALETLLAAAAAERVTDDLVAEMRREIERQRVCAEDGDLEGFLVSDRSFHDHLYERAMRPRTRDMVQRLRDVADRYIYMFLQDASHRAQSIDEHLELVELCARHDRAALQAAVRAHVERGRDLLLEPVGRAEAEWAAQR
jgi:DNA-binding GntR family transcriptional regulator